MPAYETTEKGFEVLLVKAEAEIARLDLEVARLNKIYSHSIDERVELQKENNSLIEQFKALRETCYARDLEIAQLKEEIRNLSQCRN